MIFRVFHISLAILVYLSSIGFSLNRHFCKNELKAVSILLPAATCVQLGCASSEHIRPVLAEPEHKHGSCCKKQDAPIKPGDCCQDVREYLQLDPLVKIQDHADSFGQPPAAQAIAPVLSVWSLPVLQPAGLQWEFLHFRPPLLIRDIPVLIQCFLN